MTLEVGRGLAPSPSDGATDDRWALVSRCVKDVLSSEVLSVSLVALDDTLTWARHQVHVIGWEADRLAHQRARDILRILGQLHLILRGPVALGTPWRFVD